MSNDEQFHDPVGHRNEHTVIRYLRMAFSVVLSIPVLALAGDVETVGSMMAQDLTDPVTYVELIGYVVLSFPVYGCLVSTMKFFRGGFDL